MNLEGGEPAADTVLLERVDPGIVLVTLNRPHRLNAIDDAFIERLHAGLDVLEPDA